MLGVGGPVAQHGDGLQQPEGDEMTGQRGPARDEMTGQRGPGRQHPQCRGRGTWPHRARHPGMWNSDLQQYIVTVSRNRSPCSVSVYDKMVADACMNCLFWALKEWPTFQLQEALLKRV